MCLLFRRSFYAAFTLNYSSNLPYRQEIYSNLECISVYMSITQGGSGFPFLAEPVYHYICTGEYTNVNIDNVDVPDPTLRFVLGKVY